MEEILKIMAGILGIIIPIFFVMIINKGINNCDLVPKRKLKWKQRFISGIAISVTLAWILSLSKILDYHDGDLIPRFAVLLIMFAFLGILLIRNKDFQNILSAIPLAALVGIQKFRFAGIAFILVAYLKILPEAFQLAGYGDILTGTMAILSSTILQKKSSNSKLAFWVFNIVGLLDLLNVAFLLLLYYPEWYHKMPTSESATQFSLVLIPAVIAPIAMLLHIFAIFNAGKIKSKRMTAAATI